MDNEMIIHKQINNVNGKIVFIKFFIINNEKKVISEKSFDTPLQCITWMKLCNKLNIKY